MLRCADLIDPAVKYRWDEIQTHERLVRSRYSRRSDRHRRRDEDLPLQHAPIETGERSLSPLHALAIVFGAECLD
jgi:hypothetical protein